MGNRTAYLLVGIVICLAFSFTLYNGNEVPGKKIVNTVQIPIQQKLVKVIDDETQANKMIKSGFVLQDVDIYNGKKYYTLVLY